MTHAERQLLIACAVALGTMLEAQYTGNRRPNEEAQALQRLGESLTRINKEAKLFSK